MKIRQIVATIIILALIVPIPATVAIPPAPPEVASEYGFAKLDEATMKALLRQAQSTPMRRRTLTLRPRSSGTSTNRAWAAKHAMGIGKNVVSLARSTWWPPFRICAISATKNSGICPVMSMAP